jgi:exonuclease VII small subunit
MADTQGFERLVAEELALVRASQVSMEAGLTRVYAHLIQGDKARSRLEAIIADLAAHVANLHASVLQFVEEENRRLDALEELVRAMDGRLARLEASVLAHHEAKSA